MITAVGSTPGSMVVDGVFYNTSSAAVLLNGVAGTKNDLQPGMIVTVRRPFDNNTSPRRAATIEFTENMEGPVDCVNILDNAMTVLGQAVLIMTGAPPNQTAFANFNGNQTIFANMSTLGKLSSQLNQNSVPSMVKISGFTNSDGSIQATRVELMSAPFDATSQLRIRGTATGVDIPGQTFMIGNLSVDTSALLPGGLPIPFHDGLFVEVKATGESYTPGNAPSLTATSVRVTNEGVTAVNGDHVTVDGFVSGLSGSAFKVGGVSVSAAALFLPPIANSDKVEVEGTFVNGVLVASRVTLL